MKASRRIILVTGPTASGKTACVDQMASVMPVEVINADLGQFYTALSIGTAKPHWRDLPYPCHLFDWVNQPIDVSVMHFREQVLTLVDDIFNRGCTPIIVGGSVFYIKSLLYPPVEKNKKQIDSAARTLDFNDDIATADLWDQLYLVDADRAHAIHKTDRYRIVRALMIWQETGVKPSLQQPTFDLPWDEIQIVYLTPPMPQLTDRINQRTAAMIAEGWIDEARSVMGTEWEPFVKSKNFIGYTDVMAWIKAGEESLLLPDVIRKIEIGTRQYAKRQVVFLNKLMKDIQHDADQAGCSVTVDQLHDLMIMVVKKIVS